MMEFTAEMIAGFLGGEIVGNKEAKVHTVSSIEEGKAGSLSYLTNPKYEAYIYIGVGVQPNEGIVEKDAAKTVTNFVRLGNDGSPVMDSIVLDIMLNKGTMDA